MRSTTTVRAITLVCALLLSSTFAGALVEPSTGNPACDAARKDLVAAASASRSEMTLDVVQALASVAEACAAEFAGKGPGEKGGGSSGKKPGNDGGGEGPGTTSCQGGLLGAGILQVIVTIPFVASIPYEDSASIDYKSSGEIYVRDATGSGFSAPPGKMRLFGVDFDARSWGTGGDCGTGGGTCHVTGYAEGGFHADVSVYMVAELSTCT